MDLRALASDLNLTVNPLSPELEILNPRPRPQKRPRPFTRTPKQPELDFAVEEGETLLTDERGQLWEQLPLEEQASLGLGFAGDIHAPIPSSLCSPMPVCN